MTRRIALNLLVVLAILSLNSKHVFAQTQFYFPQLVDGGGYVTTFYLAGLVGNVTTNVSVEFYGQNGAPLSLATNRGTATVFSIAIPSLGAVTFQTSGVGGTIVGWAKISSDYPIGATEVFEFRDGAGVVLAQAGVLSAEPLDEATMVVTIDGRGKSVGIAMANTTPVDNTVTLTLYNQAGTQAGTSTVSLGAGNQIARFVNEFTGLQGITLPFDGVLNIKGTSALSLVGLLLNGSELSTLATFPAPDGTLEGAWNIVTTPTGTQLLATYSRGGTFTAVGNVAAPGPCHGVWKKLSHVDFASTCERFDFDAAGNWVGRTEYRQSIRVSSNLEEFSGRVQFRVVDRLGAPLTTGEGTLQGTRVNVKAIQ